MVSMLQILKTASREKASDIHILANSPPILRVNGQIIRFDMEQLTKQQSKDLCYSVITDEQKGEFESKKDLDFGFTVENSHRYRGHIFYSQGAVGGVFRQIPMGVPSISEINLPEVVGDLAKKPFGLILVTGPTGSGKSTTLAALIDLINSHKKCNIVTVEDPIEYIYENKKSVIVQREVGHDTSDFEMFLSSVVRMDCDVCLVGELRDRKTVESALHLAETGHLTFGTLHTNNAYQTIERLVGMFDGGDRSFVQNQLSMVLQGVVSQRLIPLKDGKGRVPALEVLLFPASVRNLVKEGKLNQIYSIMQTQAGAGMLTLNQSLSSLYSQGLISKERAEENSYNRKELENLIRMKSSNLRRRA